VLKAIVLGICLFLNDEVEPVWGSSCAAYCSFPGYFQKLDWWCVRHLPNWCLNVLPAVHFPRQQHPVL